MFIEDLDRHQWNLEQAKQHTEELIVSAVYAP
jgi:hypothetical protein